MPVILCEGGRSSIPVIFASWEDWRRDRTSREAMPPPRLVAADNMFCAMCWGAGRILSPARNGEGLVPIGCDHCAGWGTVRRTPFGPERAGSLT